MNVQAVSPHTSTAKVVLAAALCLILGQWFANLMGAFDLDYWVRPAGYLAGVFIASRIAREHALTAVFPTAGFLLLLVVASMTAAEGRADGFVIALLLAGTTIACLIFGWWLGRRALGRGKN